MIETLKKQWFVVLIALILTGFAIFAAIDTNKGKLAGKSAGGKDLVAALSGDNNITADDLYDTMYTQYGDKMIYLKWQQAVANQAVETTDEIKEEAKNYETSLTSYLQQQVTSSGGTLETVKASYLSNYGFEADQMSDYCLTLAKIQKLQGDYIEENIDELFTTMHDQKKGRSVSHILIKMTDANNPTDEEKAKVKSVEDALAAGKSFEDVAKEFSDDTSAEDGGYLGYMDTDTSYVESFKNAAFALEAGKVSEWVKESNTNYNGWHLIKVNETDKDAMLKDEKLKDSLYQAIANGNADIASKYLWNAAKDLDITYADDEMKQKIMDTLGVKE